MGGGGGRMAETVNLLAQPGQDLNEFHFLNSHKVIQGLGFPRGLLGAMGIPDHN